MIDAAYRLAAQAAVARMLALRRLNLGLGVVTLPLAVRRSPSDRREQGTSVRDRAGFARPGNARIVQRRALVPLAGSNRTALKAASASAARIVAARRNGVGLALLAHARPVPFAPVITARLPAALARRAVFASMPGRPRLAASSGGLGKAARRAAASAVPGVAARARPLIAVPMPQQAAAPGFQRTVRQPQAKAAMGHVYLDKTLVGYHLAAAITAEQTRAAARPGISGSSFNSSMAALRPSGAQL